MLALKTLTKNERLGIEEICSSGATLTEAKRLIRRRFSRLTEGQAHYIARACRKVGIVQYGTDAQATMARAPKLDRLPNHRDALGRIDWEQLGDAYVSDRDIERSVREELAAA